MAIKSFRTIFPKLSKLLTAFVLAAFLTVSFLGIFDCMSRLMHPMGMSEMGSSTECPPMLAQKGVCHMNLLEHLSVWQRIFTADFTSDSLSLLVSLLFIGFVFTTFTALFSQTTSTLHARHLYYQQHFRKSKLYNYFLEILARGIIQPKLYA